MPGNASQAIIAVMLRLLVATLAALFRSRFDLILENLALRQQLAVFKDRSPRPQLSVRDRLS